MFSQASFGVALLDLPDHGLIAANSAFEELCGRQLAEMSGQPILQRLVDLPPGIAPSVLAGEVLPVALEGASARWVRISVTAGEANALAIVEDVSEAKSLEAQMIHSDRLAHLGGLATTLQHDLSQPLNIIRLTAENALDRLDEGTALDDAEKARQIRSLNVVMQQLKRVQELFDLTWGYGNPPEGAADMCDVGSAIKDAVERVKARPCASKVRIEHSHPLHSVYIFCHTQRLSEVVFQLILNACEAIAAVNASHPDNPAAGLVRVDYVVDRGQETLTISVEDDGPGLKPALARKLSNPELSSQPTGKGLGLLVAFGIAAELGGFIEVPKIGAGTRFDIVLPLGESDEEKTPPHEEETK
ncbi:MAG TPA: ATP-binding protein [Candidatus Sulfotelmatobacter sp.]|nr:ATP-binding protein [Candidatus Sulfotelmatobacter sp.]